MIDIAERAGMIFLCGGSILGMIIGAAMLFAPHHVSRVNKDMSKWVETSGVEAALDKPHWTERVIYRHHRLVGLLLLAGAGFVLKAFFFGNGLNSLAARVGVDMQVVIHAAANIFIIGAILAALVGIIMLTRPSLLKEIENSANRWVATDAISRFFNHMNPATDHLLMRYRRFTGWFLMLGGLYIAVVLGYFLFLK